MVGGDLGKAYFRELSAGSWRLHMSLQDFLLLQLPSFLSPLA